MGGDGVIEEVAAGIFRIESALGARFMCQYLLVGDEAALLVDTGLSTTPAEVIEPALERLGASPSLILVSHADVDHCGGNRALRARHPRALLACHELDRRWIEHNPAMVRENYGWHEQYGLGIPSETRDWIERELGGDCPVDLGLRGGETLRLGTGRRVEVLHLPGESPGHVGIWDEHTGAVIASDAVLESGIYDRAGNRLIPPRIYDLAAYRRTIRALRSLDPELLLTAHYPVMGRPAARRFLDRSLRFTEELEGVVRRAVAAGVTDLKGLTDRAVAELGPYPELAVELAASVRAC